MRVRHKGSQSEKVQKVLAVKALFLVCSALAGSRMEAD